MPLGIWFLKSKVLSQEHQNLQFGICRPIWNWTAGLAGWTSETATLPESFMWHACSNPLRPTYGFTWIYYSTSPLSRLHCFCRVGPRGVPYLFQTNLRLHPPIAPIHASSVIAWQLESGIQPLWTAETILYRRRLALPQQSEHSTAQTRLEDGVSRFS